MKKIVAIVTFLLMLSAPFAFAQEPCEGNFDCDQDVDGSDASLFKSDY